MVSALLASGCGSSRIACDGTSVFSTSTRDGDFDDSRAAWLALKGTRGDTYCYSAYTSSFSGASSTTVVEVRAGVVVSRQYRSDPGPNGAGKEETWIEDAAALGSHAAGAPPQTVDALYDDCKSRILALDPATNTIMFKVDAQTAVMRYCQGWRTECQDDCASGPGLESLVFAR